LIEEIGSAERIVFDLDGTIYDTRDFERPALAAVAEWLRAESGKPLTAIETQLWRRRESERHRPGLFDDLLREHGLPIHWGGECLRRFHAHPPIDLRTAPSLRRHLVALRASGKRLALVSNGEARVQAGKCAAIGLDGVFDRTIFCGPDLPDRQKPSAWAWTQLSDWRQDRSIVYVGDDPVDARFAEAGNARYLEFRFGSSKDAD
jgi:FMN phosphatase YigB (HAD superfamily)